MDSPDEELRKVLALPLWAWVGADDQPDADKRTDEIGLKIGVVPAGRIPMAAVTPGKMQQDYSKEI